MSRHTYMVPGPDGIVFLRTTERVYTHVVVGRRPADYAMNPGAWEALGWCGRHDLAIKKANGRTRHTDVRILEVPQPAGVSV